ncbi:MAG: PleD family two-component system response regulator [Halodesulfurarchaeum sp.]
MTRDIVIADDDDAIREVVEFKMRSQGWNVRAFENGRECWEYLEANDPPAVVVLDIMMPGLSGLQILQRIREDESLSSIPVLLLTSRGREEHVVEGFEFGATDYVTKPFSPTELLARIEGRVE